jgi:protein-S-isoprenylcysteine O-methyltransferase Ste14
MKFLNLKIPPPIILAIAGVLIYLLRNEATLPIPFEIRVFAGGAFIICGISFDILGLLAFQKQKTTINPMHPENTSAIVQNGIYARTRNPMYLGQVFILIGWSIINKASFGILIVPLFIKYIETFQIKPEEEILGQKFEQEYLDYIRSVRRWI